MLKLILWGVVFIAGISILFAVFSNRGKIADCVMNIAVECAVLYGFLYLLARCVIFIFLWLFTDSSNAWITSGAFVSFSNLYVWIISIVLILTYLIYGVLQIPNAEEEI